MDLMHKPQWWTFNNKIPKALNLEPYFGFFVAPLESPDDSVPE